VFFETAVLNVPISTGDGIAKTSDKTSLASYAKFIMTGSSPAEHKVLFSFYIEIELGHLRLEEE
jgi:hypothetical protein